MGERIYTRSKEGSLEPLEEMRFSSGTHVGGSEARCEFRSAPHGRGADARLGLVLFVVLP